jgi:hypothetical protein
MKFGKKLVPEVMKMAADSEPIHLFQSGELVPIEGTYEVIGADSYVTYHGDEQPVRTLRVNERFPSYKGRAVCWRLSTLVPSYISVTEMIAHSR